MLNKRTYAVFTGDLIGFSKFKIEEREVILSFLKTILNKIESTSPFMIYRGDSFQGVISRPEDALKVAITIRASLLSKFEGKKSRLDARIAIGLGTIDYLPVDSAGEGDGEAFRNSGMELDRMKKREQNLTIRTPWAEINEELRTECALLDALIERWTKEQAEAIMYQIQGLTQEETAGILHISQPAVFQRLRTGGSRAVQDLLERFKTIIQYKIKT